MSKIHYMVLPQSSELQSVLLWSLERCLLNPKFHLYIQLVVFQNGIYPCLIFRFPVWGFGKKQNKKSLLPPSYHKKYQELSRSPTVSSLDKEGLVVFLQNTLVMARVFV